MDSKFFFFPYESTQLADHEMVGLLKFYYITIIIKVIYFLYILIMYLFVRKLVEYVKALKGKYDKDELNKAVLEIKKFAKY